MKQRRWFDDYKNFSNWISTGIDPWGNWDSVEKFLYKDGGGVKVEIVDQQFKYLTDESGNSLSDHAAAEVVFKFTKTEDFVENTQKLEVVKLTNVFTIILNTIKWIFKDLIHIYSHVDELIEFIG